MIEFKKGLLLLPLLLSGCRVESSISSGDASEPIKVEQTIVVSAASSMTDVLKKLTPDFEKSEPRVKIQLNFGASQTLEQQIEKGAPADVFISASSKEMDELEAKNLLLKGTREDLLSNTLVLVAKPNSRLTGWEGLTDRSIKHIAVANPKLAPAGDYAKQTLIHMKLWDTLQPKVVLGENVRQTLTYVTSGDADAGIVFGSDATAEGNKLKIITTAKEGLDHGPISYPVAVLKGTASPGLSQAFIDYLKTPPAQKTFRSSGFRLLATGLKS